MNTEMVYDELLLFGHLAFLSIDIKDKKATADSGRASKNKCQEPHHRQALLSQEGLAKEAQRHWTSGHEQT